MYLIVNKGGGRGAGKKAEQERKGDFCSERGKGEERMGQLKIDCGGRFSLRKGGGCKRWGITLDIGAESGTEVG